MDNAVDDLRSAVKTELQSGANQDTQFGNNFDDHSGVKTIRQMPAISIPTPKTPYLEIQKSTISEFQSIREEIERYFKKEQENINSKRLSTLLSEFSQRKNEYDQYRNALAHLGTTHQSHQTKLILDTLHTRLIISKLQLEEEYECIERTRQKRAIRNILIRILKFREKVINSSITPELLSPLLDNLMNLQASLQFEIDDANGLYEIAVKAEQINHHAKIQERFNNMERIVNILPTVESLIEQMTTNGILPMTLKRQ